MNMRAHSNILRASVAIDGTLVAADPPILQLQEEAGGALGQVLAVPALAAIARLAGRLEITVSRPVIAAGRDHDVEMWVRAKPEASGVQLSIIDWQERPALTPAGDPAAREADFAALGPGWTWQVDTQMTFMLVAHGEADEDMMPDPAPAIGSAFTRYFILAPDDSGDMAILRAFAQRRAFRGQQAVLAHDRTRSVMLSGYPLFDAAGRLMGYRGKAAALIDAAGEAVHSAALATGYSVEFGRRLDRSLRRPLSRIIANADTISAQRDGPLRPDYAGYADDIAAAGRHLMALIDDLADLQAIDRPDFAVEVEEVDLADLARRAAGLLGVKALDRAIRIDPPGLDETLSAMGEFRRVLQILVNLIGNAVRYSPEGSQVWVTVGRDGALARVSVADQGSGIAADAQEKIFDKFERLGREEAGGSGLGLYISRRLARAMGGDIVVDSAPDQGARFTLFLPTPA
ncbi:HAMP domain-containing sensor histidine kinase [Sphingobium sp. AN641]|uniref:sensor histidine kinase n=1 Tax=Sphingobium sp. AN641 TaxID=3133443 RepID=UPI0030BD02F6